MGLADKDASPEAEAAVLAVADAVNALRWLRAAHTDEKKK
jgi:hypothetical protein